MRKDHRVRLNAIKKSLGLIQAKLDYIADEMAISQRVVLEEVLNDFDYNEGNQIIINSKHISNSSGQIGCALECISEAFDNVRRVK